MSTSTRRRWLRSSAALALGPWLLPARAEALRTIRIGVANAPIGTPPSMSSSSNIAAAYAKGWVEKEFQADGICIEWNFFKGTGPAVNEALTTDQLDFALQGDLPALVGRANGLRTRVLLSTSNRTNVYIAAPAAAPIASVNDLRGKRVAFAKGTMTQLPANRILEAASDLERDLRIVSLDTATSLAALASNDIDAVFGGATLLRLRNQGVARIVHSTQATPAFTGQSVVLVTERFAQAWPQAVQRVVTMLARSAHWSSEPSRRDEVLQQWARGGTPKEVWDEEFQRSPLALRLSPRLDPFLTARLAQSIDDAQRYRLIRKRFEVEQWIDRAPLDAALQRLGLAGYWKAYDASGKAAGTAGAT